MFDNQNRFHLSTVKVVFIYLIISILWIAFTDRLLDFLVSDPLLLSRFQTIKGWFFVLATSALLFWLIKRLNRSSNEQSDHIKSMFNHAGVGILHLQEGRIADGNLTVSKLLGYDIKTLTGRAFVDFVHPNQQDNIENALESARNKEEGHVTEAHLLKKDGSDLWGELVISDVSISDKPMQEIIIVDVSEKRAFEAYTNLLLQLILSVEPAKDFQSALRSVLRNICQELHWEAGFAFTPDQQKDVYHKEVGWHTEGEQFEEFDRLVSEYTFAIGEGIVGTTVESLKAQWVEDLANDERFKQKKDTTRAGMKSVLSVPVIADQSVIAVLMLFSTRKQPLNNNLMRFFSGIGSEIGDKLARKREQELLRKIFENIPVMITTYRLDLEDISVNREFEAVTGWKNDEIPDIDIFDALYPDQKHQEEVKQFMANPGQGWKDLEMVTKSGKSVQTSWTNIRLSDDTLIGIGWDITERKRYQERSIRSIIEGSEQERKRVAKELHDGLAQYLTAASLNLESLHGALARVDKKRLEQFDKGLKQLHYAIEETRRISHNLLPRAIEEFGLSHATESLIQDLEADSGVTFSYLENIEDVILPDPVKLNIYRILQEGLNNALRYSKCDRIDVRLILEDDILACRIQDNGMGFDVHAKRSEDSGLGLISMQNRAEVLKGTLTIQSKKNEGTVILVEVPVNKLTVTGVLKNGEY
ncbi:MAG: PAS domain S-box protein [Balneolaceae bacterium]